MSNLKINQFAKNVIEYHISTQLKNPYESTKTFFECDGDEYMFIKTFRKRNGVKLERIQTYKIVFDETNTSFKFESIK